LNSLAIIAAILACLGLLQGLAGLGAVVAFCRRRAAPADRALPPVSILKPLHGDEPMLEAALASFCAQDYPQYQIVFGVQHPDDPAIGVVQRLRARFPSREIDLVIDSAAHGVNRKVSNLINMLPAARHDLLVLADSDVHVSPATLRALVAPLADARNGLVTTLYGGLPAEVDGAAPALVARLGATQINHAFLPGVLMARALGRQDCMGASVAIARRTLAAIGGLPTLAAHLADDAVLGQRVRALGLRVALADTVPLTTVPEADIAALLRHELRWARTNRSLAPFGFAFSSVQYPLFWALLCLIFAAGSTPALGLFATAWLLRAAAALGIDRLLRLPGRTPLWLLPVRDVLSMALLVASYAGNHVSWRGHHLYVASPRRAPARAPVLPLPAERLLGGD